MSTSAWVPRRVSTPASFAREWWQEVRREGGIVGSVWEPERDYVHVLVALPGGVFIRWVTVAGHIFEEQHRALSGTVMRHAVRGCESVFLSPRQREQVVALDAIEGALYR